MRRHLFVLAALTLGTVSAGPTTAPDGWKLVWGDEFDKAGAVDASKWRYEAGMIRNNEAQYYTRARRESYTGERDGKTAEYTSGSIESMATWTYGRIEVRAKLPHGRGSWPAIW